MQSSISEFMKIAITVVVIAALLFVVGYKMVDSEVTNTTDGYQKTVVDKNPPVTTAPPTSR